MGYQGIDFEDSLTIETIYSIHYFEYQKTFSFDGESHDFWEFIYVDKGEVMVTGGDRRFALKKGQMAFHHPGEFHAVTANGTIAPNLVVISFSCRGHDMDAFRGKILEVGDTEEELLGAIILEARQCFDCRMDDPYLQHMPLKSSLPYGAGQLIRIRLEELLIHLVRRQLSGQWQAPGSSGLIRRKANKDMLQRVEEYLELHVREPLTVQKICHDNLVSRTQLERLMRQQYRMGVIQYFSRMKIEAAREMIRLDERNFTQISETLGYRSVHYFSRQFKQMTGMTPSEYASSVKAIAEGGKNHEVSYVGKNRAEGQ